MASAMCVARRHWLPVELFRAVGFFISFLLTYAIHPTLASGPALEPFYPCRIGPEHRNQADSACSSSLSGSFVRYAGQQFFHCE